MSSSLLSHHHRWTVAYVLTFVLATLILLFGIYFIIFGAQLAWLGGSWYYVLCGILLAGAGFLMLRRHPLGAWLYLIAWFLTIPWTIYEAGFDLVGWVPRLFGPTLIAIAVALTLPYLYKSHKGARHHA